jgi:large subunit ribosomal protein L22
MASYKYAYEAFNKETMAKACSINAKVSLKKSVELAKAVKTKKVKSAINYLERVKEQEAVVPYTRYNAEMAHKRGKGIDTGGYPIKVADEFLKLIKSAQKNAEESEISGELYVLSASARKGIARYHSGRYAGRSMKSTNIEIIIGLKEKKTVKKKEENKK